MNTEQMVRKCFCYDCEFMMENLNTGAKLPCKTLCPTCLANSVYLARAARRFVKMEQADKSKRFFEKFKRECRRNPKQHTVMLPKHFGEMRTHKHCNGSIFKGAK